MLLGVTSTDIAAEIMQAKTRLYFCGAGLDKILTNAIKQVALEQSIHILVFVDAGAHARRLGYGDHSAIEQLHSAKVPIYDLSNTRLSFCIVDEKAWIFSQTAALVEQPDKCNGFNCVEINGNEVGQLVSAVQAMAKQGLKTATVEHNDLFQKIASFNSKPALLSKDKLAKTAQQLVTNPPQSFDVSRQVTVFNSRLEFVELELTGAQIERHVFKFPEEIKKLFTDSKDAQKRLSASYKIIGDDSKVSSKDISQKLDAIRSTFLKSVGKLGRVILRAQKQNFELKIRALEKDIEVYQRSLAKYLTKELEKSRDELIKAVLDRVHKNPPDALKYNIETPKVSKQQAKQYLIDLFNNHMPPAEKLMGAINLNVVYKGVTYETLKDPEFVALVKKQFPSVDWLTPLEEFTAAKASHV